MNDELKTKKELVQELATLKRQITTLEKTASRTNRKASAHELDDKSRYIFENVHDAMIYLDKKGFIVEVNKEGVRIFGGLKRELVGKHFTKIGIFSPDDISVLLSSFKTVLGGKHTKLNLQIKNKKQEIFLIECSASPMKTRGKIAGMVAIMRDVTERMRAENALLESERFLQNVFGAIQDGISVLDTDLNVIRTNYWMEKTYADQLPLKGRKCYRVYQRRESPCPWCPSLRTIDTGETNTEIVPYPSKDNPSGWIELTAFPVKDDQDRVINVIEYVKDISDRKRAEDAVRSSEERFRNLAEMLPEAVFETDRDLNLTFANRRAFELFGYSYDDMKRVLNGLDMITPEDRDRAKTNLARRARGENPGTIEYQAIKKDGSTFPVHFHANSIMKEGELVGLRGIIVDITERKIAENDLHYRLRMEELIMKISSKLISIKPDILDSVIDQALRDLGEFVDADRCYVFQYRNNEQMMDNTYEWCRKGIESQIHRLQNLPTEAFGLVNSPEKRKKVINIPDVSALPEEASTDRKEFEAEGIKSILCVPMFLQNKAIGFLGFDSVNEHRNWPQDTISLLKVVGEMLASAIARIRSEEALRSSEERYRKLVENATEGIVVAQDHFLKFTNPRIEEITSYSRGELLSKPFLEFIHPDDREFVIDNQMKRLKGKSVPETYEIRVITKYGETKWLRIGGVIIAWEGKPASLNFIVDITETKRLRELESRAQRLETAGQIAGQVAHDFNNLLAPLITYPEFISKDLPKNHPALPYLKDIEKAAHKIADINQQLLTLGRRGHYNLVPLNLNDVISEVLNELVSLPRTLVIDTDLAADLMNIKAGRAQIHRMISNMINNSRDATQDIGRIAIKTENFYADNVAAAYGRVPRGEYVKLTISDTGHGISEDIIQKIFDPFYTTKSADKRRGSGLGLSIVDSVVKDHCGFLDLRSKVGEGTSFFFYFPITREDIDDQVSEQVIGGNESILVVDDDDVQRKVSLKILASLGYRVKTVEGGEKAVELLRQKPYDLLFLDMIMTPGIDGTETLRQALEINPLQRGIIVSGFAETERVQEALELGAGAFLRKPLTIRKMAAAVRKELDKKEKLLVL